LQAGVVKAEDGVPRRDTEGNEFGGDLAIGPVLLQTDLAVVDAYVQDDCAVPAPCRTAAGVRCWNCLQANPGDCA
jgi:hypothetical protein